MDKTLINTLKKLASKEKNIKEFKKRLRIKGRVSKKELTKKGNIKLSVQYKEDKYPIIILKSHNLSVSKDGSFVDVQIAFNRLSFSLSCLSEVMVFGCFE